MAIDKHEQIRQRAYEIWEAEGRPDGADQRHWLQACDELAGEDEHETLQNLLDEDDRDDAALLQGAGESGDLDRRRARPVQAAVAPVPDIEMTTGEKPSRRKIRKTEGP
ncbi:DUF2934 domain-containing protein [Rhizobium leguminosarum]|jgi:hypothetical protein|uniref:DUF2934 domain-containing protein n=2 Tax=Rhizobium TaxID=379 RepID=A0A444IBL6_RHILE|nr:MULTISPECIES: DUF2934 domain-containing protein [Rhizobium]MBY5459059.1 DUF2934 domain-containing protein [Rhizobium leguminosarum]NKL61484.1 DUF2934 domain-containing protein [Rhizobium leguminosarum bv. viciae]RWX04277.1 DUF2934 domain-containing protein [Rhizobium leguminosarum]RWX36496.1 DUF2934 domain-containing protein [Rhizobium leguminosarum]TAU45719.1 DUF2934 domain-containing protein [Rhizobium leguminosarum]